MHQDGGCGDKDGLQFNSPRAARGKDGKIAIVDVDVKVKRRTVHVRSCTRDESVPRRRETSTWPRYASGLMPPLMRMASERCMPCVKPTVAKTTSWPL